MAIKLFINNGSGYVDYSKYVVDGSLSIEELINQPVVTNFTLSNFDTTFVLPRRSAYVRIISTQWNKTLATGFITQEAERTYLGPSNRGDHFQAYNFQVTSDEWLLNIKTIPFAPAYVNQTMGQIIRRLAEALVPATPGFYGFDVDAGDIVPFFKYDPKQMWSEIVKTFADSIRYRYKVMDHVIYFKPYGDQGLGVKYDDSPTRAKQHSFDPRLLQTTLMSTPVINDAIVIGDVEARSYVEDNFIGDGLTTDFTLKTKVFRGASSLLLEDQWDGTSFSKDLWNVVDPDGSYALAGALNVVKKNAKALGTSYVLGNNGLELGGHLNLQHGEVAFTAASGSGIIGGVYSSAALTLPTCLMGFFVTGGGIRPVVNGVLGDVISTIAANRNYLLQTIVDAGKFSRYDRVFRTLAGTSFGGTDVSATTDVTFMVEEIPVASPGTAPVFKKTLNQTLTGMPSFALYAPLNSISLQLAMTFTQISQPPQGKLLVRSLVGPTGTELPILPQNLGPETKYMLGFGLENQTATLQENQDVQQLRFYIDTIPASGSRIRLRTWESGRAVGRVRDVASVTAEAVVSGDDGVRSAMVADLNPLPRTSVECELAGKAFILDRTDTQYNGSYSFQNEFWNQVAVAAELLLESGGGSLLLESSGEPLLLESGDDTGVIFDYPRPGRYFNIKSPMRDIPDEDFVVRRVRMQIGRQDIEKIQFQIEFGPDLYVNKLLPKFLQPKDNILLPKDAVDRPVIQDFNEIGLTFIPDFPDTTITSITGTQVTIDLGSVPASGAEVRRVDSGWGLNNADRITLVTTQTFSLTRSAYDETFYIRQVNGAKTSRYTSKLRVVYPQVPTAPTGELDVRDWLKPTAVMDLTGDIRNIHGLEIRSCMISASGAAVTGQADVTGTAATGAADMEIPQECLDLGLIGDDLSLNSTIVIGSQDFLNSKKKFTRSEFLFDPSLFDVGTEFYFEACVTNGSFTSNREVYIEKQMRGRSPATPTIVQTLTIPPQAQRRLMRFPMQFTGHEYDTFDPTVEGPTIGVTGAIDYTDAYRVWMQSEAPPVLVYPPSSTIFPDSPFELHELRIIAITPAARKTVIDIAMSGAEGESNQDNTATAASFIATTGAYVEMPCVSILTYNSAEWDTIKKAMFQATLSTQAVSGAVKCALFDATTGSMVIGSEAIYLQSVYGGDAACVQAAFPVSGLVNGHKYTPKISLQSPAASGFFFKANIRLVISPLRKTNVYWRFLQGPANPLTTTGGNQPYKVADAGTFASRPGCISGRFIYAPDAHSSITNLLCEYTGYQLYAETSVSLVSVFTGLPVPWDQDAQHRSAFDSPAVNEVRIKVNNSALRPLSYKQLFTTDQFSELEFVSQDAPQTAWTGGPAIRMAGNVFPFDQGYALTLSNGGGGAGWFVYRYFQSGPNYTASILFGGTLATSIQPGDKWRLEMIGTTMYVKWNGVIQGSIVDTVRVSGYQGINHGGGAIGANATRWTNFKAGALTPAQVSMVDGGTHDGAKSELPGWFGYKSGDHIPAQNWTTNPNFATALNVLNAVNDKFIDDYGQCNAAVIMSAWQFELFAAVLNNAAATAGVSTENSLRNVILSQNNTAIDSNNDIQKNWVQQSKASFSVVTKDTVRSSGFASTVLTAGNRFFGSISTGVVSGWMIMQVVAINNDEFDASDLLPVPGNGTVLVQRVITAPSDLTWIFDNVPYRVRNLCFNVYFFNLMWEYSQPLNLNNVLETVSIPKIEVISILSVDVQVRLDVISVEDTVSVTVEMSNNSLFLGKVVRVKGGPLQSIYSLHIPGGPTAPIVAQYIRARRTDYLGSSDWSQITYISADDIKNSSFFASSGLGTVVSKPLNNLFTYAGNGSGFDWQLRTIPESPGLGSWASVSFSPTVSGGLLAAVAFADAGGSARVATSQDGIAWTRRGSAESLAWRSIVWADSLGLFVAVASSGVGTRVMTSPDGVNWTSRTSAADNDWRSIAWNGTILVAVASTGTGDRVMTSTDGINWVTQVSAADNDWKGVCWSSTLGLFVAVAETGTGNRVMTSPNGTAWTIQTSAADNAWQSVVYAPAISLLIAVANTGTGNRVMTSPDGLVWTIQTTPVDNDWTSITWSESLLLAVAIASGGADSTKLAMISKNGTSWSTTSTATASFFAGFGITTYGSGLNKFVAVGAQGQVPQDRGALTSNAEGSIVWSWAEFSLTYSDGFIQYVASGSKTFTGLAPSTTYKFYPYLQGVRQGNAQVVILLSSVSGGTGDDSDAIAQAAGDGRTPLSRGAMSATTASAGGSGSGSGGGVG